MVGELEGTEDTVQLLLKSIDDVVSRVAASSSVTNFRQSVSAALADWEGRNTGKEIPSEKMMAVRVSCEVLARHLSKLQVDAETTDNLKRAARDKVRSLA